MVRKRSVFEKRRPPPHAYRRRHEPHRRRHPGSGRPRGRHPLLLHRPRTRLTAPAPARDALIKTALDAGATLLKPATKTLWGYGGVLQAPDGTIIKIATSAKKNTTPVTPDFDEFVLLLGVQDVTTTKQYYTDRGLNVGRSFGSKYVEFTTDAGHIT